jgi:hypothetical protein
MKQLMSVLTAATIGLVGCAANPQVKVEQTAPAPKAQTHFETTAPVAKELKVPAWYIQPPETTAQSIFSAGEATGPNLGMTMHKAMLDADAKLAFQMKSMVKSMVKSFKTDNGKYSAESSELLIRKITSTTVIGHQQVDSQVTQEGNIYRVFVLMRYPLGESNRLLQESIATTMQQQNSNRGRAAMEELNDGLKGDETVPKSQVKSVVVPEPTAQTDEKSVKLLDVDNDEYKRRRDEALQKPGAVVGQITLR